MSAGVIAAAVLLAGFATASAQTPVLNPTTVEFDPSPEHAAIDANGAAIVQRYELRLYRAGQTVLASSADLGKPQPGGDGKIRVDFSTRSTPWPPPDGTYEARVAAVGAGGAGESDVSNQFSFAAVPPPVPPPPACAYSLSAPAASVGAAGGSGTVSVSAGTGCEWSVSGAPTWLALGSTVGTGSGALSFTAAANLATSARAATLSIAGSAFTLTQAAAACTYALSPGSITVGGNGTSGSVTVTTLAGCGWTAASSASWLTLGAAANGSGSSSLGYSVAKNTTGLVRVATISAAGRSATVTQGLPGRPSQPKKPKVTVAVTQ
jgi:hypothetical protein